MSLELIRSKNQWLTKVVLFVIAVVFTLGFGYSFVNFGTSGLSCVLQRPEPVGRVYHAKLAKENPIAAIHVEDYSAIGIDQFDGGIID